MFALNICKVYLYPIKDRIYRPRTWSIQLILNRQSSKLPLLGMKCVFKDQDLQMFGLKLSKDKEFSPT